MRRHGRLRCTPALLALALAGGGPATFAGGPQLLRIGTLAPAGSPWHDVLLRIRDDWRRISAGQVELKIMSGTLGGESDMILKMRVKQLHAVAISGAALPQVEPGVACLQLPLAFESYAELDHVLERITPRLERRMAERGFVVLNWGDAGWVHFFTKHPAATPADMRKLSLLTIAGDPETEKLYKEFGFKVVPLPYTDVLVSLETNLIQAVQGPPLYALIDQWFGLATYMTDLKWAPLVGATVMRKDAWDALPEAWRDSMLEAARVAGRELAARIRRLGEEAVPEMRKRGLTVVPVDDAARRLWRAEVQAAYPKLRDRYAPAELIDEVLRVGDAFRAAHAAAPAAPAAGH